MVEGKGAYSDALREGTEDIVIPPLDLSTFWEIDSIDITSHHWKGGRNVGIDLEPAKREIDEPAVVLDKRWKWAIRAELVQFDHVTWYCNGVTSSCSSLIVMAILGNVLGFGAFGMAARAWQLGVQKRPILQAPGSYLLSGAVFGTIGYWLVGVEERQNVLLAQKRKELESRRNAAQTL